MINGHDFCPPLSLLATLRSAATAVHEEAVSRRILTADCRHGRWADQPDAGRLLSQNPAESALEGVGA